MTRVARANEFSIDQIPSVSIEGKKIWSEVSEFCWKCAFDHIGYRDDLPSPSYMDCAFDADGTWVWDTALMSMYARYAPDAYPGIQSLDNFYAWQDDDGYISMAYNYDTQKPRYETPKRVNPPLFAWVEMEHYRTTGRSDRIERVLPHLIGQFEWIAANRRCEDFELYWFEDGGSSGMDNSPRGRRNPSAGRHMAWVDLSSQMAWMALCIDRLARAVGRDETAARFLAEWKRIGAQVEEYCWCPVSGFYHDRLDKSNWLSAKTIAGFWPMLAEFAPDDHVERLCAHLEDPRTFGSPCPVPSLSRDDPNYRDTGDYWLGGVWSPTNYMVLTGLKKYGKHALSRRLAIDYLDHVSRVYSDYVPHPGTIWEAYSAERPEPARRNRHSDSLVLADFAGWTALAGTAILYESILGLETNVPTGELIWRIGMTEEHGVERFPFGAGSVDIIARGRSSLSDEVSVSANSTVGLTLVLEANGRTRRAEVPAGKRTEIVI